MKIVIVIACLLVAPYAVADEYQPIAGDTAQFNGHYLYQAFFDARNSNSIQEAISKWEAFVEESRISSDPEELDDVTHYELYRWGIAELMRLYYTTGQIEKGDDLLKLYNNIRIVEVPKGRLLKKICRKSNHQSL